MNTQNIRISEDTAKLLLRIAIGGLVLFHGLFKIMNPGVVGFIGGLFTSVGLPAVLAYLIYIGEVVAPIMLILGYRARIAAALIAFTLLVALFLAHRGQFFSLNETGGWMIELQALYLLGAIALVGLGAGKYALDSEAREEARVVTA